MKLKVNKEDDTLYLRLGQSRIIESEEVEPGVILDFNDKGQIVGIEMLGISKRVPEERLRIMQVETV